MDLILQGAEEVIPVEDLENKLEKSRKDNTPLKVKFGCDPSRPDLHIGHAVVLRKLKHFQDLGHEAVLLIGDFTAMIGDPSGRNKTRPQISLEETRKNAQTYIDQASLVLSKERLKIVYNSDWLNGMDFTDVIKLSSKYTVARMLERDDFTKRFESEIPISMHEFLYPLAQAMDSVEINADVELGGTDQKFNLLVGRDLQREYKQSPQAIITLPLLEGTDGVEKMSKSHDNYIALDDSPEDMYGKVLSISDDMILKYYKLAVFSDRNKLESVEKQLKDSSINPRDIKRELAKDLVSRYYNDSDAQKAEEAFDQIFIKKDIPEEIPTINLDSDSILIDILVSEELVSSKGEAKRLIGQNAVKVNGKSCDDPSHILKKGSGESIIKVGKRRFLRVLT